MLLNTTIHALIASTTAAAAHVIARLFVRSASPVVFAEVPKQGRKQREMRWRYLLGLLSGCSLSDRCCETDSPRHSSDDSSLSRNGRNGTGSGRS
jgi:hypothetical protein